MVGFGGPQIERGENVLLYSPPFDPESTTVCFDLLGREPDDDRAVLEVTYDDSPGKRVAAWEHYAGSVPEEWVVITVDSKQPKRKGEQPQASDRPAVESVTGPGDLTALGTRITKWLQRWDDRPLDTTICLCSITSLFQYTEQALALRFLDALTTEVSKVDAFAHYHLNPNAHDTETREAITARFDRVIDPREG